jgi:hypothetical protein
MHGHGFAGALRSHTRRQPFSIDVAMSRFRSAFLLSVSITVSATGCAKPSAVGSPSAASDNRSASAAYQANLACMAEARKAAEAGASEVDRARIARDCISSSRAASDPIRNQTPGEDRPGPSWIAGVDYEKAGRYAEAAAVYQKMLNDEGYPNGDGLIAGERLGYLYANGFGVPKNEAKAWQLFSVRDSQRNRTDLALMDHNLLPRSPEGVPDAVKRMEVADTEAVRRMVETSQSMNADYTFICPDSENSGQKVVTIDSRRKAVKLEETTFNTRQQCISIFIDGTYAPTKFGENVEYCSAITGGNDSIHQSVTIDSRNVVVRLFRGNRATVGNLSLDFGNGILRYWDGLVSECHRAHS